MSSGKTKLKVIGLALAVTLGSAAGGASAYADNDYNWHNSSHQSENNSHRESNNDHDGDRSNDRNNDRHDSGHERYHGSHREAFNDNDRQSIRVYMHRHHHHWDCPTGLARKHNGCRPPGKARYEVGRRLPDGVEYVVAPYQLRRHLHPAPHGYQYIRVDDDVLLMSKNDRTIIDAVSLLSDLAR
jgi:Ni/Co efflux regulator RcnB